MSINILKFGCVTIEIVVVSVVNNNLLVYFVVLKRLYSQMSMELSVCVCVLF